MIQAVEDNHMNAVIHSSKGNQRVKVSQGTDGTHEQQAIQEV